MSGAIQVSMEEADTQPSDFLERVERGEEVTIGRAGRPVARQVAAPLTHDVAAVRAAVEALFAAREELFPSGRAPVTIEEIIEDIHAGRKC